MAMDRSVLNSISTDVDTLNQKLDVYNSLLGNLSKESSLSSSNQAKLAEEMRRTFDHIKSGNGNFRDHISLIKDAKSKMKDLAAEEKQAQLQMKLLAFATDDLSTKVTKSVGKLQQMGKALQGIADFMSKGAGALGSFDAVKSELQAYNQEMFTLSRQAQIMGRDPVINGKTWDNLRQKTTLARSEFVKFNAEMNRAVLGIPEATNEMVKSVERFQKAFGQIEWEQQYRRINVEMQNLLPGFKDWIKSAKEISEAGNFKAMSGDIKDMAMAMNTLGADAKQLEAMYSYLNKTIKEQDALMSYDVAVKKRQQAIKDMNLAMGKNSEKALIAIEEGMTKLVEAADKVVNAFSIIPTVMMSMSAIGLSSITSLIGGMKTLNAEAKATVGSLGRMKNIIGFGGAAMAIGTAGMSYLNASSAAEGATGMADKYRTGVRKDSAMGSLIASGAGAVIGGALGSVVPVVGTGMGAMAGSAIGGMGYKMFGGDKVDERFAGALSSMENLRGMDEFEGFNISSGSESGLATQIRGQHTQAAGGDKGAAKRRNLMIQALLKAGYDENKLKEMGLSAAKKAYDVEKERLDAIKDQIDKGYEQVRQYQKMEKQMKMMVSLTKEMAASYESMSQFELGMGAGAGVAMQQKRVEALKESYAAATKALDEFQKNRGKQPFSMAAFDQSGIGDKLTAGGATADEIAKFRGALSKGNMDEVRSMAEKFNLSEEILDNSLLRLKALEKSVLKNEELKLQSEKISSLKALEAGRVQSVSYYYEEQAKNVGEVLDIQSRMTKFVESTAAGIAASFQMRRKEYDLTKEQRRFLEQGQAAVAKSNTERIKGLMESKEAMDELRRAGVGEGMINRLATGTPEQKAAAMRHVQEMIRGKKDLEENETLRSVVAGLEKEIDLRKRVIDLKTKEVQLAVQLKEGYLDVIAEMTTGSDLVSKLLPDAQRGIVALHRVTRQMTGDDMGGALTRGFVSVNAFKGSMDISNASKYTQQGFYSGNFGSTAGAAWQRNIFRNVDEQAAPVTAKDLGKGPSVPAGGTYRSGAGEANVEGSVAVSRATGGIIPGSPSSVDNRMALMDGKEPIKVASGEYIVNAKQTQKFLPLLEAINSGMPGFAGGGEVLKFRKGQLSKVISGNQIEYLRLIEDLRKKGLGNHQAIDLATKLKTGKTDISGAVSEASALINKNYQEKLTRAHLTELEEDLTTDKTDVYSNVLSRGYSRLLFMKGRYMQSFNEQDHIDPWYMDEYKGAHRYRDEMRERISLSKELYGRAWRAGRGKSASELRELISQNDPERRRDNIKKNLARKSLNMIRNKLRQEVSVREAKEALMEPSRSALMESSIESASINRKYRHYDDPQKRDWTVVGKSGAIYNKDIARRLTYDRGQAYKQVMYGTTDQEEIDRRMAISKSQMSSDLGGFASGGIANAGGLNSLSVAGGLRIGVLSLNGKVIGQDVSGGLGDEWKIASQNANG